MEEYKKGFDRIVSELSKLDRYKSLVHLNKKALAMPSTEALSEIMELLRAIIFPGYFMEPDITPENIAYYTGSKLDKVFFMLAEQIKRGMCFVCAADGKGDCASCEEKAKETSFHFVEGLPEIRRLLALDVEAAYEGDPAALSYGETIYCYPSIYAMTNFRIAHRLHELEVPLIPRILTEMAHSKVGIDIHPGATVGEKFFMDHGTGIVIGGTSTIGNNVKLYQGVTLGAKSFPLDENGNPIKGIPRHPIVEDNVVVYSGATILGRIRIGKNSTIGGNVWLTKEVPENSRILKDSKD